MSEIALRILHVSEPVGGGVAAYVHRVSAAQQQRGHVVQTLAPEGLPRSATSWDFRRGAPAGWWRGRRQLVQRIGQLRPDVVHAHSFFAGLPARSLGHHERAGSVLVFQPHAWATDAVESRVCRDVIARWECFASKRTDLIMYVSEDERRQGESMGLRVGGAVVGVPVDLDDFAPQTPQAREIARLELGLPPGRLLVCVGRLSRQKGQELLAAAWERTPIPGATLLLVGPGDVAHVRAVAPRTFGSSLRCVGAQSDVERWLWAADAVVQSSRYEGMSTVVGEALAAGRPVYSTPVNGAREAIVSPKYGPPAGAVEETVQRVLTRVSWTLDHPDVLMAQTAAASRRVTELYGVHQVLNRIDAAYEQASRASPAHSAGSETPFRVRVGV